MGEFKLKKTRTSETILTELNQSALEYLEARDNYEAAQAELETRREKLKGVRDLAREVLDVFNWMNWQADHREVQFAGMPIGEAILSVLRSHAYQSARTSITEPTTEYTPIMSLYEIVQELEDGGFEFRTIRHGREVNAALINAKGIEHVEVGPVTYYKVEDAEQILEQIKKYTKPAKEE